MELFPLVVNVLAAAAIIVGLGVLIWWVVSLYWVHARREERDLEEIELPGQLHEIFTGIPVALWTFYIFILASGIVYVIYIWVKGISY